MNEHEWMETVKTETEKWSKMSKINVFLIWIIDSLSSLWFYLTKIWFENDAAFGLQTKSYFPFFFQKWCGLISLTGLCDWNANFGRKNPARAQWKDTPNLCNENPKRRTNQR